MPHKATKNSTLFQVYLCCIMCSWPGFLCDTNQSSGLYQTFPYIDKSKSSTVSCTLNQSSRISWL